MEKNYFENVLMSTNTMPISSINSENTINLSIGEPHFEIDSRISNAIEKSLKDKETKYSSPQGIVELREKYVEKNCKNFCSKIDIEDIIVGAGVSNLINLLFMSVLQTGDRVLLIEPYYFSYLFLLKQYNVSVILIPELFSEYDLHNVKDRVKMILFSNPSNPSGYCMSATQMKLLAEFAERNDSLLVSDEIYSKYDYDGKFISAGSIYEKACILNGFSKSHSMTGLRLGIATGPHWLIQRMVAIQTHLLICIPTCVQRGGVEALDIDIQGRVEIYKRNRDKLYGAITKKFDCTKPSGGFYMFFDSKDINGGIVHEIKEKCNIVITPGSLFTEKRSYVRVAFCVSESVLNQALEALLGTSIL